jgi:hypothetical protein
MSVSVFFALRNAVNAARIDSGDSDWFQMGINYKQLLDNNSVIRFSNYISKSGFMKIFNVLDGPATIDTLHKLMKIDSSKFLF